MIAFRFFPCDISWRDTIIARPDLDRFNGALTFRGIKTRGGHSTYRIRIEDEQSYSDADKKSIAVHLKLLEELGCDFEPGDFNLIAIDVAPGVPVGGVFTVLDSGEKDGIWDWEAGYVFEDTD